MPIDSGIQNRAFAGFSAESTVQAMMIELDASAAESSAVDREATDARFDAAEDAIDHAADKARRTMWAGILHSSSQIAGGIAGTVSAGTGGDARGSTASVTGDAASASGATGASAAANTATAARSTSTFGRIAATSTDDLLELGSTMVNQSASRAALAEQRAELRSKRDEERADASSERAARDRALRDTLGRQLDEVMRQRHSADERAAQAIGG